MITRDDVVNASGRPLILDLFCGAGGAAVGYHRAGFDVVGVDVKPQPHYPFPFIRDDAIRYLCAGGAAGFDSIHASPPCQAYSTASGKARKAGSQYPDLIAPIRASLRQIGLPYIIENVANSPLIGGVRLCGSSFGLSLRRHRYFETDWMLWSLPCEHHHQKPQFRSLDSNMTKSGRLASVVGVYGNCHYSGDFDLRCSAMGIDWMTNNELTQAVPPAYTEYIGAQLLDYLTVCR